MEMSKKCVKKGENPNIPYPQCGRSIKISGFKQQCVPNMGTKNAENGGNWGKTSGKLARCAPNAPTYSLKLMFVALTYIFFPEKGAGVGKAICKPQPLCVN